MKWLFGSLAGRPQAPRVRPVCYRAHRTWLQRLQPLLVALAGLGAATLLAFGAFTLVLRLNATDAQLDAAYLRGMAAGQTMCRSN